MAHDTEDDPTKSSKSMIMAKFAAKVAMTQTNANSTAIRYGINIISCHQDVPN
jgi:hypothetical protein